MNELWKEASIGEVKVKIKESEPFLNAVRNDYLKNLDVDTRNQMIGDLADLFILIAKIVVA